MSAASIIEEIKRLPLADRLIVVEKTLQAIRQEKSLELKAAADLLYEDYISNEELTAFTALDPEAFYEAK